MANVFVAVAIPGVFVILVGRVRVICLVEGSVNYDKQTLCRNIKMRWDKGRRSNG